MSTPDSRSVGDMLRAAREIAGMSVAEVAERTRIRASVIRDIEADDFAGCGDTFYARGHVRSIATTVGLDPGPVLLEFDARNGVSGPTLIMRKIPAYEPVLSRPGPATLAAPLTGSPARVDAAAEPSARSRSKARVTPMPPLRRARSGWTSAMIVVAAIVALFAIGTFIGLLHQAGAADPHNRAAAGATPSAVPSAHGSSGPGSTASPSPLPVSGVSLQLRADRGDSWIRVTDGSGAEVFQGLLTAGTMKQFQDSRALSVKYGNAHAVTVLLNGKDRGSPSCGGSGVCTVKYEPDQPGG
ncbi:MAG: DUF4115 domain-containing protein [Actinomycetota bacterium]|nr:DUF4115 domain-containing protein [Actinomycetota bacterium]